MKKITITALLLCVTLFTPFLLFSQDLRTDFSGQGGEQLIARGDYVLRGTVLVQYQGNAQHVTIPANLGITEIAENVFQSSGIVSVTIPEGVQRIGSAFRDCYNFTTVRLPNSLRIIGDYAFHYCDKLTNVSIPAGVTIIGGQAFYGCDSLTSITIPPSVTYIGEDAFRYCSSLTSITADGNNPYYSSQDGVLYNKVKTVIIAVPQGISGRVTIPEGITYIDNSMFSVCTSLTSIAIPASFTYIGSSTFSGCTNLTAILVDGNNPNYSSQDGIVYNKGKTEIIVAPQGISGNVTIPAGVTSIGSYAFDGCSSLTSITIPAGVTSIGSNAFRYCSSLASITIPANITLGTNVTNNGFNDAYNENGKQAGTYTNSFDRWVRGTATNSVPASTVVTPGTVLEAALERGIALFYRVTVPSNGLLLTTYTVSSLDTLITLYDGEGRRIAYDDDSGSGNNAKISRNVSAGIYYIKVSGYSNSTAGPFTLYVLTETAR